MDQAKEQDDLSARARDETPRNNGFDWRNPPPGCRILLVACVFAGFGWLGGALLAVLLNTFDVAAAGAIAGAICGACMEAWPLREANGATDKTETEREAEYHTTGE